MWLTPSSAFEDLLPPPYPGAFAWWYLDLVDENGDGAVLIWGFALPFLDPPADAPALQHPFVNVAAYEGGTCVCYHLERLVPELARLDGGAWRLGASRFRSWRVGDRWQVEATLDLPIAGSNGRLTGEIRAEGPAVRLEGLPEEGGNVTHRWAPLCMPATGRIALADDKGWTFERTGRVYHDRNTSNVPLPVLGIGEWAWGHLSLPDAEAIHYACWPRAGARQAPTSMAVHVAADGAARVAEVPLPQGEGRVGGWWGFPTPATLTVGDGLGGTRVATTPTIVDESPFYVRFPLKDREGARGWGERVRPDSISLPWMRPLVRMRVHSPEPWHSLLPAFSGPRPDRARRVWGALWT